MFSKTIASQYNIHAFKFPFENIIQKIFMRDNGPTITTNVQTRKRIILIEFIN